MAAIGNNNLLMVRLDADRRWLVEKLMKAGEREGDFLRRCIDALAEKEGVSHAINSNKI